MNLVFMNSLEKKGVDHRVSTAQVLIQENQGIWHVLWNEPAESGGLGQSSWFEGRSWDEMLTVFRYRLAEKMTEGYSPLLGGMLEHSEGESGKTRLAQMLHYYSELKNENEVFQKLRKWRMEQSSKEGNRPYILASNRVLKMINVFLPYTREELLQIPGFGVKKADMYGDDIMKITKSNAREKEFPLDWVPEQIDYELFNQWTYKQKELKYKQEMEKQVHRKKLLDSIQEGKDLDAMQSELSISRKDLMIWIEQLDKEGYDIQHCIHIVLKHIPEEDKKLAWNAFEQLGDRYLKPVLQKIYSEETLKEKDLDQVYEWLRLMRIDFRKQKEGSIKNNQAS